MCSYSQGMAEEYSACLCWETNQLLDQLTMASENIICRSIITLALVNAVLHFFYFYFYYFEFFSLLTQLHFLSASSPTIQLSILFCHIGLTEQQDIQLQERVVYEKVRAFRMGDFMPIFAGWENIICRHGFKAVFVGCESTKSRSHSRTLV